MPKPKSSAPQSMTAADAHALADRLERRSDRGDFDSVAAAVLIRALLRGRAAGDVIEMKG